MAMPQRDDPPTQRLRRTGTIEAIKRLEPPSRVRYGVSGALLEYAVMHGDGKDRRVRWFCGRSAVAGRPPYRREDECGII